MTVLDEASAAFHYFSLGLENAPAEEWLARPEPLAWALAALMRPVRSSRPELKLACLRRIAEADLPGLDEAKRFLLVNCVETYLQLLGDEAAQFEAARAREEVSAVRVVKLKKTWAEQMQEEIEERVREQVLHEGREQGRQQAARQSLLRLLKLRFGPLPAGAAERIETIHSVEVLTRLAEQVVTAGSLSELGFD